LVVPGGVESETKALVKFCQGQAKGEFGEFGYRAEAAEVFVPGFGAQFLREVVLDGCQVG